MKTTKRVSVTEAKRIVAKMEKHEALDFIHGQLGLIIGGAIGETCVNYDEGIMIVTEWETEAAARKAAAFMSNEMGRTEVSVSWDRDLGWTAECKA